MKSISFFKRLCSYFWETLIEERTSELNGKLSLYYQYGHYVLNSENANYSFQSLHKVFQKALSFIAKNSEPESILNLGMGAGSTLDIIRNDLKWQAPITSVEHDPIIVDLAKEYFELENIQKHEIHIKDVTVFLKNDNNTYDLILVDLFRDTVVPQEFLQSNFFRKLHSLLNENGRLVFNFICKNAEQKSFFEDLKTAVKEIGYQIHEMRILRINRVLILEKKTHHI